MAIDIGSFVVKLARKIEATTDPQELLVLTKAISKLKTGSISTVSSYSLLPTITTSIYGEIYLVENEPAFYFAHPVTGWQNFGNVPQFSRLYSWGSNCCGQLGNSGTYSSCRSSPAFALTSAVSDWRLISASAQSGGQTGSSAAIKANGTLWTWGTNGNGHLGTGTTTARSSPGSEAGGGTTWAAVQIGSSHSLATKTDGTLWTWGNNSQGALGTGTSGVGTYRSSPGTTAGGGTNWTATQFDNKSISVSGSGSGNSAAIKTDGTLWIWGVGGNGYLGDGTAVDKSSPVTVAGGGTTWCAISLQSGGSALKTDGTLWTWGANADGQLGDGTTTTRSSPVTVAGGGTTWCAVSGRAAIKTDGTLWTWGRGQCGRLGDGTIACRSSPGTVAGGGTTWCLISAGGFSYSGAIKTDGTLWTWGYNNKGQLGTNNITNRSSPGTVSGGGTNWSRLVVGSHTLALDCYSAQDKLCH